MKLEQQVVSLELARKLKELGVKQESYFYWCEWSDEKLKTSKELGYNFLKSHIQNDEGTFSAYTVAELGEMLKKESLECVWFEEHDKWGAFQTLTTVDVVYKDTEADARAGLLIYLLENKLITL